MALVVDEIVASGVPLADVTPPLHTIVLLFSIPMAVGTVGALVRTHRATTVPAGQRRAEAVMTPRPRRSGVSGSSNPSPDQARLMLRLDPLELPDALAG
jgi:hypothetical protein